MNWIVTPGPTPSRSMAMKNETVTVASTNPRPASPSRWPPCLVARRRYARPPRIRAANTDRIWAVLPAGIDSEQVGGDRAVDAEQHRRQ